MREWWESCMVFRESPAPKTDFYRRDNRLYYLDTDVCTRGVLKYLFKLDTEIMFTMSEHDKKAYRTLLVLAPVIDPNGFPKPTDFQPGNNNTFIHHSIRTTFRMVCCSLGCTPATRSTSLATGNF